MLGTQPALPDGKTTTDETDGKVPAQHAYPVRPAIARCTTRSPRPFGFKPISSQRIALYLPTSHPTSTFRRERLTLEPITYLAIAVAAVLFGIDKSLASGAGLLSIATLTAVMPAHQATGLTLLMAICADWSAIWAYRGNVSVKSLVRLLPFVVVGIAGGIVFLYTAGDMQMRRTIGIILGVFVAMYFISQARKRFGANGGTAEDHQQATDGQVKEADDPSTKLFSWAKRIVCGILAGFTTMVANAAGPVTAIFFLSENLPVMRFLGTTAWFYLIVNLIKLPISIHLGMITWQGFLSMAWTIPLIIVTVFIGRTIAKRVNQETFTKLIYVLAVIAVVRLLV